MRFPPPSISIAAVPSDEDAGRVTHDRISSMDRREHWQRVYTTKAERQVSWFETVPSLSLQLMDAAGLFRDTATDDR